MTDAIEMKALHTKGETMGKIARNVLEAGCNLVLYCEGDSLANISDIVSQTKDLW